MKLRVIGKAGQGIKTMSLLLGKIMAIEGHNVAINNDYGANVRSGKIQAEVVISKKKIDNPKIENPDLIDDFYSNDYLDSLSKTTKFETVEEILVSHNQKTFKIYLKQK